MTIAVLRRPGRGILQTTMSQSPDRQPLSSIKRDLRVIRACLIALLTVALLTGGVAAGALLAPTAIAVILALVLAPITHALERISIPPAIAALLTVGATVSILVVGTATFAPSLTTWVKRAPEIVTSVERKLRPLRRQLAAFESASQQFARATTGQRGGIGVASPPEPIVDGGRILTSVASTVPSVFARILYVGVLTIFLLSLRRHYTEQLILLPRLPANRLRVARICRDVRHRVSGYLFTLASINAGLVVVTALAFWIAGIPDPLLWGIAYGILNFVPIIGPTTIIAFAALVGFATAGTMLDALLPPLILLGIDVVEAYLVQPWLLSRRLVISPIAIFVTVATLVWMWGAPAAIIAVPALILLHTVLLHVPSTRPFAALLATEKGNDRIRLQ
ncbi:MAG: AI-2E family transporter [Proteobacteria bacterium]|nr:AI-2E family transporter [Pseudomonadota bacterium]